jgi:predicted DNA-binding transcriptional regulator AlpA
MDIPDKDTVLAQEESGRLLASPENRALACVRKHGIFGGEMSEPATVLSPLLTVEETAAYLGMSRQWCYQKLKVICPPVRIGGRIRWLKEDLDRMIQEGRKKPAPAVRDIVNRVLLRGALRGTRAR